MRDAGDAWRALAERALGRSLESLADADRLAPLPLYPRRTSGGPRLWRAEAAWTVAQRVDHPDCEIANRQALADLEGGAGALTLCIAGTPEARGIGLEPDARALAVALADVELDFMSLRLEGGPRTRTAANALRTLVETRRLTSAGLDIDLGFDPVAIRARTGRPAPEPDLADVLDVHGAAGLAGRPLLADGRPWHEAGADAALELACTLAAAIAHLRRLERHGLTLDAARRLIAWLVVVDAEVFASLAKVKAARRLWARIETAADLDPVPLRLHAETAWRMLGRADPWINAMRTTAGVFAAGLGGADCVGALPCTLAQGLPDDAARRLARNSQRILIDEARFDAVADPAAGAGALDTMTDRLCEQAWALFQALEQGGGIEAALADGRLARDLDVAARARARAVATLERPLVGTTRFPRLDGPTITALGVAPRPVEPPGPSALPSLREAEPIEAIRAEVEALPVRPRVFLVTLGTPAAFGPRATVAVNLFAVAGIAAEASLESRENAAAIAAFRASGDAVACLCGADASYVDEGEALVASLRNAGARLVLRVGWAEGGFACDAIIDSRCDLVDILGRVLSAIRQPYLPR